MNKDLEYKGKPDQVYLGIYNIKAKKPLWTQLATLVSGLGLKNVLCFLDKALGKKEDIRSLTYHDLSAQEVKNLESFIEGEQIQLSNEKKELYFSNCKNRSYSSDYVSELSLEKSYYNTISLNSSLKAEKKLNIQRLTKMNSYVGARHFKKYKVHGQSTKSTGRKNKIARGFIKKKQQKKLERINNAKSKKGE